MGSNNSKQSLPEFNRAFNCGISVGNLSFSDKSMELAIYGRYKHGPPKAASDCTTVYVSRKRALSDCTTIDLPRVKRTCDCDLNMEDSLPSSITIPDDMSFTFGPLRTLQNMTDGFFDPIDASTPKGSIKGDNNVTGANAFKIQGMGADYVRPPLPTFLDFNSKRKQESKEFRYSKATRFLNLGGPNDFRHIDGIPDGSYHDDKIKSVCPGTWAERKLANAIREYIENVGDIDNESRVDAWVNEQTLLVKDRVKMYCFKQFIEKNRTGTPQDVLDSLRESIMNYNK